MTQADDTTETIETPPASETAPAHSPDAPALASADAPPAPPVALLKTPLHALHVSRGGRMVPFAGYEMPVQYADGIIAEHNHVREHAGLFDVSHMGQAFLVGADHETVARALEALVPADIVNLAPGRQRYTQFTNPDGGILDDLMVTRSADPAEDGVLFLVVNAATKEADCAHLAAHLPASVRLIRADHRALIAVQGPMARLAVGRHCPEAVPMTFMSAITTRFDGIDCHISRSGYTGEDGFEISCKATRVRAIAERLLSEPAVKLIGLGARDSLRLEAGLCLYGHDIDSTTSPVEAALTWSIQKRRRDRGRVSRRGAHPARAHRRARTPARWHQAGGACARARGNGDHGGGRCAGRRGHFRRLRPERQRSDRDGLCRGALCRARYGGDADGAQQADAGARRDAAVRAAQICSLAHDRDKWTPVFGKDHAQKGKGLMATRYTKDHEWIRLDGDVATVGITEHAQNALGDIVYVELPEIGKQVEQGARGRGGGVGEGGERRLCAGDRRSGRREPVARRRARNHQ